MIRAFQTDQFPTKAYVDQKFEKIDRRLDLFEQKFESELGRMADRITIRLGGMMIVGFGAMAALIKLT